MTFDTLQMQNVQRVRLVLARQGGDKISLKSDRAGNVSPHLWTSDTSCLTCDMISRAVTPSVSPAGWVPKTIGQIQERPIFPRDRIGLWIIVTRMFESQAPRVQPPQQPWYLALWCPQQVSRIRYGSLSCKLIPLPDVYHEGRPAYRRFLMTTAFVDHNSSRTLCDNSIFASRVRQPLSMKSTDL